MKALRTSRKAGVVKDLLSMVQSAKNLVIRVRHMTPFETLRFMGVNVNDARTLCNPYNELGKRGFSEEEITELLTVPYYKLNEDKTAFDLQPKKKKVNLNDSSLYKMAGNSIVVNVLTDIFEELFIPKEVRKQDANNYNKVA